MTTRIEHLDDALKRMERLWDTATHLAEAQRAFNRAMSNEGTEFQSQHEDIVSLRRLTNLVRANAVQLAHSNATQAARLLAGEIVEEVRREGKDEPIVWLTGNAYVPAWRSFPAAEVVFQADPTGELWVSFMEELADELATARILVEAPEYDNALYAVDLRVWEYVDEEDRPADAENLSDEWRKISSNEGA